MSTASCVVLCGVLFAALAGPLLATAQTTAASARVETGVVKLADSNIEYFSQGQGQAVVLLPPFTRWLLTSLE